MLYVPGIRPNQEAAIADYFNAVYNGQGIKAIAILDYIVPSVEFLELCDASIFYHYNIPQPEEMKNRLLEVLHGIAIQY